MWRSLCAAGLTQALVALVLAHGAGAYEKTGQDWTYKAIPMGENWRVCTTGMPAGGSQRTRDGANGWNYTYFNFSFGPELAACTSYPSNNGTNQVDFGPGLGVGVLAQTTVYYIPATGDITECDMRFNSIPAVITTTSQTWYTGTGSPSASQYDWWSVAAHEMGHCLGLGHEDDPISPTPVMKSTLTAGETRRMPTSDDTAGRNSIYGTPCATVAFASRGVSALGAVPAAVWLGLPVLFVAGWRLRLRRTRRSSPAGESRR